MKRIALLLSLTIVCGLSFLSCSSGDEPKGKADYYVKYEVYMRTNHINATKKITVSTDNGVKSYKCSDSSSFSWEATYGPVSRDFIANLNCTVDNGSYAYASEIQARIYICRGQEPFVVKAEGEGKTTLSLNYQIDF